MKRVSRKTKTIPEIYEEFQQHNKVKNLSEHTITYYYWNLKHLFDYLTEKKIAVIAKINSEVFDDYILWLKERYSNAITINTYLRSARVFLYYSMSKDYLPSFKIHMIKAEDKVIQTYSELPFVENPSFELKKFKDEQADKMPVSSNDNETQSQNGDELPKAANN